MIQIDMKMPKSCFDCDKTRQWKNTGRVQCPHIDMPSISSNRDCRPPYCPLKEVPTGHWIDRSAGEYRCSNCEKIIGETDITDAPINSFKYCPFCGAKMENVE